MTVTTRPFAINTYSYTLTHSAEACIEQLAERGFADFELMLHAGHLWPTEADHARRAALRRMLEARGLRVIAVNAPNVDLNIAGAAAETRDYSLSILSAMIELAGELGAAYVVMGPGKPNPLMPMPRMRLVDYLRSALEELAPRAERAGTSLVVENMPVGSLPDAEGLMHALDAHGDERIGVVYDVANAHFIGEELATGLRRVARRLRLVHLADTDRVAYRHDPVGAGSVDFAAIPPALAQTGRRVPAVLEITSDTPDVDIEQSVERLLAVGWPHTTERHG